MWAIGEAAGSAQPKPLPCQALDHGAGYLMAFGAMTALARRVTEGGSWHVRVSLAQTGHWIRSLGRIDGLGLPDVMREEAFKLCTDESHHAFFSQDMCRQVAAATGIAPDRAGIPRSCAASGRSSGGSRAR